MPRLKGRQPNIGLPIALLLVLVGLCVLIPISYFGVTNFNSSQNMPPSEAPSSTRDAIDSVDGRP